MDMSRREVKERSKRNCQTHHTYCTCLPIYMYMLYMHVQCMYMCIYEFGHWVCGESWHMPQKIFNPLPQFSTLCPMCLFVRFIGWGFLGFFLLLSILLLVCYTHSHVQMYALLYMYICIYMYTCIPAFTSRLSNSAELAPPFNWMLNSSTRD